MRTLVIDNGTSEVKLNWAGQENCVHVQNAMMRSRDRRLWLGNAVDLCKDLIGLQYRRPLDRGQLYSWELEKPIWDWIWDTKEVVESPDEFKESNLVLTETPGTLPACSGNTDQIIFEEYEFANYRRCAPQVLAANAHTEGSKEAKLVVDLGFYATHVVPVFNQTTTVDAGIRRLDIGGKMLTNYLKETISYRYYNMMEESAIINRLKERTCFTSLNFGQDLEKWYSQHQSRRFTDFAMCYALPSTHEDPYGHVIPDIKQGLEDQRAGKEQVLILENERFSIPESLFDPFGHLGIDQAPLPEVIADSIASAPSEYQPLLWSNIVLCGGTANIPNLSERIGEELRKWAPADVPVDIFTLDQGTRAETAWRGGSQLCSDGAFDLDGWTVSRSEYLEQGPAHTAKKMAQTNKWTPTVE